MQRQTPIFSLIDPQIVTQGLALDRHPLQGGLWRVAENVEAYAGALRKTRNRAPLIAAGSTPLRGFGQLVSSAGIRRLYTGNSTHLFGYDFSTLTSTGTFTGPQNENLLVKAASWSFIDWGDWMLATNGVDLPQIAKNSLAFAPLETGTLLNRVLLWLKSGPFVLAVNTQLGTDVIQWSNANDPEDWVVGATKSGGNIRIKELDGPITAGAPLGSEFAIYGEEQVFRLGSRDAPFWFGYFPALDGIGAVGPMAVCSDGRFNYGVSRQGIWMQDGFSYVFIDALEGREMREWLQRNVNWSQASKIIARRNELANSIDFAFPILTSLEPNLILRFNLASKQWTTLPRQMTAADQRRIAGAPISARADGLIFLDEQVTSEPTDNNQARLVSRPLLLGTPRQAAYIDEVQVLTVTPGTLEYRIGAQHTLDDPINWTSWFLASEQMQVTNLRLEGVYFTFEARSTAAADAWQLAGFLLYGEGDGLDRTRRA